jgi:hypothetical protein
MHEMRSTNRQLSCTLSNTESLDKNGLMPQTVGNRDAGIADEV